jgi:Protein of unknown function (DUF4054)
VITSAALRTDFPEFKDVSRYPDPQVNYWLQIAALLLNQDRFGAPAPFQESTATIQSAGANYAAGDTINLAGGTYNAAAVITVNTVDGSGAITGFSVTNLGQYTVVPQNPVAQNTTSGVGTGASFNLTWVSGTYTAYDFATELFVGHNLVLERRAQDEADMGAAPGVTTGPIASKSVAQVSVSYDVAIAAVEGMGDLNLTIYGTRFAKLVKMFGMGPISIVGNNWGGWLNGPGWAGPIYAQGVVWDC